MKKIALLITMLLAGLMIEGKSLSISSTDELEPLKGIVFWDTHDKLNEYKNSIALEFSYCLYCDIVQTKGNYDWTKLETMLDNIAARGHQAVIRFRYEYPGSRDVDGNEGTTAVPAYIKQSEEYYEKSNYVEDDGLTFYADWSNEELMRFTKEFYEKLAEKYDSDPRIAFIQLGFGHWSEYHISGTELELGINFPTFAYQKEFLLHVNNLFKQTPWSISIDAAEEEYSPITSDAELMNLSFGLFDDSFMHEEHDINQGDGYNETCWNALNRERWKTFPGGGEFSYYKTSDQKNALNPAGMYGGTWEERAAQYHITYMIGNDVTKGRYGTPERVKEASAAAGYKFVVTKYQVSGARTEVKVKNTGVAPIYHDAYLTVNNVRCAQSLKGLLPGIEKEFVVEATAENNEILALTITSDKILSGKTIPYQTDLSLPDKYVWKGNIDNVWNNPANWAPEGVPGALDSVFIPKSATYPVLEEATAIKEIHFEPGAEIGNQHYLTGDYKAHVQLDFSAPASRDRWYMLSNPLQQLYAGDFSFGGYPGMDMKLFETDPVQGNKAVWKRITGLEQSFSAGDGFIVWLAPDREENKGLKLSKGILELPYFDKPNLADVHWTHTYNNAETKSTFKGWKEENGSIEVDNGTSVTVNRDLDKAYRLAGKTVEEALDFGDGYFAIAGNPYMSSIDFAELQKENPSAIKGTYQIWIGPGGNSTGSYAGYNMFSDTPFGREDANLTRNVAVMQSFIVEKLDASNPATLSFDLEKIGLTGGIRPDLRSDAPQGDKFSIVASTAQAGVRTVIASRSNGSPTFGSADSRKLFGEINNIPEVYTLKSGARNEQVATAVNIFGEITGETLAPLAISTTYKGELTFTFSGMDTYKARIFLLDTETGTEIELTDKEQYEYRFDYVPEQSGGKTVANDSRFFIRLNKVSNGIEAIASEVVRIFAPRPGTLQVVSTHPLRQVTVYNLQGSRVYNASSVQTNTHKVDGLAGGVYIVKVVSGNMIAAEKVVVRN